MFDSDVCIYYARRASVRLTCRVGAAPSAPHQGCMHHSLQVGRTDEVSCPQGRLGLTYPSVTSTVCVAPSSKMGATFASTLFPSTIIAATPLFTWSGLVTAIS